MCFLIYLFSSYKHGTVEYRCEICDKKFPKRFNLKRHEQTHTVQKDYSCDRCGKSYIQAANLSKHRKKGCMPKVDLESSGENPPNPLEGGGLFGSVNQFGDTG